MKKITVVLSLSLATLYCMVLITQCFRSPIDPNEKWIKVAGGMNFPEGPAWDGRSTLYVSNCLGSWITRIQNDQADTFLVRSGKTPDFGKTNGLLFSNETLFACDFGINAILKITMDGSVNVLAPGDTGTQFHRPNDLAFGPDGFLYVTDPFHYDRNNPDGIVYRIDPVTGNIEPVIKNLAFPNGIAFSADGKYLYICESAFQRVLRFPFGKTGAKGKPEMFVELPGGDPDGIAFDKKGNLYIAHFGGGAVYIVSPMGKIFHKLETPGRKPTNLEFGGKDLKTLYLTEVETNAVYQCNVKIPGQPLFHHNHRITN
jgi:gluconolactonase